MRKPALIAFTLLALFGNLAAKAADDGWHLTSGLYMDETNYRSWTARKSVPRLEAGVGAVAGMTGRQAVYVRGNADIRIYSRYEGNEPQVSFIRYGGLERVIPLENWRGKRLHLALRLKNDGDARAYSSAQINKTNDTAVRTFAQRNAAGSDAWRVHDYVLDVPGNASFLAIDVGLTGKGTIWIDEITLTAVSDQVPLSDFRRIETAGCVPSCGPKVQGPIMPMPGSESGVGEKFGF